MFLKDELAIIRKALSRYAAEENSDEVHELTVKCIELFGANADNGLHGANDQKMNGIVLGDHRVSLFICSNGKLGITLERAGDPPEGKCLDVFPDLDNRSVCCG